MATELLHLLSLYLQNQAELSEIKEWLSLNVWDAQGEQREMIDFVAGELAYLDSGFSDEELFRARLASTLTQTMFDVVTEVREYVYNTSASNSENTVFSYQIDGLVEDLRFEGVFV